MRARNDFPDAEDIKFLIVSCPQSPFPCGGFSDRLKSFDYYFHIANKTGRVLIYNWSKPLALESFLVPPEGGLDWRLPPTLSFSRTEFQLCDGNDCTYNVHDKVIHVKATQKDQYEYMYSNVWAAADQKIAREVTASTFGYIGKADIRAKSLPYTVMVPVQRALFNLMFQPVPRLEEKIRDTMFSLGITSGNYGAAHIRASYPTKIARENSFRGKSGKRYDKEDSVLLEGFTKNSIRAVALHAVKCASDLTMWYIFQKKINEDTIPVYIASDSVDTINLLMNEVESVPFVSLVHSPLLPNVDNLHIDGNVNIGRPAENFDSVIVDMWIIKNAACVAYGVGWYGFLGALLTESSCRVSHQ
eukprot:CAMPEP_0194329080 /NCGR_PEP_ID=MMETSP0171-20130528/46964_1 /TAXON_ID=218684 /ORGANISM="Corethron pennatum, Strain L29A3" /LENGTH=358 /DNA_ID=CAMNT_0039089681 /DNA_START=360 /DNA_END=1433 /DNA_ORIENTATION=-